MSDKVSVREVGLRDGLQLVKTQLDTQTKCDWIAAQANAGFEEMEVTSFVPASILPQFADASEVITAANAIDGLTASALAVNLKGAHRALEAGAKKITFVVSASDAHSQSNVRRTTDAALAEFQQFMQLPGRTDVFITGAVATTFGYTERGDVPPDRVFDIARAMVAAGASEINLADTVGVAHPRQVTDICKEAIDQLDDIPLAIHFHDTRGLGLANVVAAFDAGVRRFDSALGGLGGCPFAPGASGNIATEDTVNLLDCLGADTGVDIDAMLEVRGQLSNWLPAEKLEGKLYKACAGSAH